MAFPVVKQQWPLQKLPTSKKDEHWRKKCIDAGLTLALYNSDNRMRDTKYGMRANYRLFDGILDAADIERTVNPWGLDSQTFPAEMQCYPIATSKINLLVGEESKRRFDWRLRVTYVCILTSHRSMFGFPGTSLQLERFPTASLARSPWLRYMA